MRRDTKLLVLAIVLFAAAAALIGRTYVAIQPQYRMPPTRAEIERQIARIQNDPHMPPQAKAIAIGQLKGHMPHMFKQE